MEEIKKEMGKERVGKQISGKRRGVREKRGTENRENRKGKEIKRR